MSGARRALVLVSGEGSNLQCILDQARSGALGVEVVGVISDRPGVRALERARQAKVPALTVDHKAAGSPGIFTSQLSAALQNFHPDLVILAGFMRILDGDLVDKYRGRMLNVHPSLLPRFPGLHTYQRALAAGEAEHGSTVHFVIRQLDAGPGLLQYRVKIRPEEQESALRGRVQRGEHVIYPRAIAWVAAGRATLQDGAVWLDGERLSAPLVVQESGES